MYKCCAIRWLHLFFFAILRRVEAFFKCFFFILQALLSRDSFDSFNLQSCAAENIKFARPLGMVF